MIPAVTMDNRKMNTCAHTQTHGRICDINAFIGKQKQTYTF